MKMVFKIDTGELVAYGSGDVSQWARLSNHYTYTSDVDDQYDPSSFTYTYDGTDVLKGDRIPAHDLTGQ